LALALCSFITPLTKPAHSCAFIENFGGSSVFWLFWYCVLWHCATGNAFITLRSMELKADCFFFYYVFVYFIWKPNYHKFVELQLIAFNWKLLIFKIHRTLMASITVCGCGMITLILNYSYSIYTTKNFTCRFNCTCPDLIELVICIRRRHPVMIVKLVEELLSQGIAATISPLFAPPSTMLPSYPWNLKKNIWLSWKWSPCRNKLFSHLEETGHAMLKTRQKNRRWGK